MQCQKMCSTGNIAQIEKFGCACNLQKTAASNRNNNLNYSNAHGNTLNVYPNYNPAPKRSPSQIMHNALQNWQSQDSRMYDRWSNELQAPQQNNNFQPMNWYNQ
jgi:D-alanyl-D-alanine dipeptidase